MTKFICEAGSCHMGKEEYLKEYVILCSAYKVPFLKFQLFPKSMTGPNVWLDPELFKDIFLWAKEKYPSLTIFSSIFDPDSFKFLVDLKVPVIKFSHSQRNSPLILEAVKQFDKVFVSYSFLDSIPDFNNLVPMFCEPVYPIVYQLDFRGIFSKFHSFSDHTLGIHQTIDALNYFPQYLEKHVTLDHPDICCPDSKFAIQFGQLNFLKFF